jgi:hypothetical protein
MLSSSCTSDEDDGNDDDDAVSFIDDKEDISILNENNFKQADFSSLNSSDTNNFDLINDSIDTNELLKKINDGKKILKNSNLKDGNKLSFEKNVNFSERTKFFRVNFL